MCIEGFFEGKVSGLRVRVFCVFVEGENGRGGLFVSRGSFFGEKTARLRGLVSR